MKNLKAVIFEMECNKGYKVFDADRPEDSKENDDQKGYLLLKGQMKHISEINSIVFLCSPMYVSTVFEVLPK